MLHGVVVSRSCCARYGATTELYDKTAAHGAAVGVGVLRRHHC